MMDRSDDVRLRAMHFLKLALEALDQSDAPADIGAHIDVAIARLSDELDQSDQGAHEARQ